MLRLSLVLSALGLAALGLASQVQAANYNYVSVPFAAEMAVQLAPSSFGFGVAQNTLTGQPTVVSTTGSLPSGMQVSTSPVITTNSPQNVQATHTVALWFQFQTAITAYTSLSGSAANSAAGVYSNHQLFLDSGNQLCHWQSTNQGTPNSVSAGGFRLCVASAGVQPSSNWNHVAYTYDSTTKVGSLYFNGQGANQATSSCVGNGCFAGNTLDAWAFGLIDGSANSGVLINHASHYNGVLTLAQINTLIQHRVDQPDVSVVTLLHRFPLNAIQFSGDQPTSRGRDQVSGQYSRLAFLSSYNASTLYNPSDADDANDWLSYQAPNSVFFGNNGQDRYPKLPEMRVNGSDNFVQNVRSVVWQAPFMAPSRSFAISVQLYNEQVYDLPGNAYHLSVLSADQNTAIHLRSSPTGSNSLCATATDQLNGGVEVARICSTPGQGLLRHNETRLVLQYDDERKSLRVISNGQIVVDSSRLNIPWLRPADGTLHTLRIGQFDTQQRFAANRFRSVSLRNTPFQSLSAAEDTFFHLATFVSGTPQQQLYYAPYRYSASDRSGQDWSATYRRPEFTAPITQFELLTQSGEQPFGVGARFNRTARSIFMLPYVLPTISSTASWYKSIWVRLSSISVPNGAAFAWITGSSNVLASTQAAYTGPVQHGLVLIPGGRVCLYLNGGIRECTYDFVVANTWNMFTTRLFLVGSVYRGRLFRNGLLQPLFEEGSYASSTGRSGGVFSDVPAYGESTFDAFYPTNFSPTPEPVATAQFRHLTIGTEISQRNIEGDFQYQYTDTVNAPCQPLLNGPNSGNITRLCNDPQSTVLGINDPPKVQLQLPSQSAYTWFRFDSVAPDSSLLIQSSHSQMTAQITDASTGRVVVEDAIRPSVFDKALALRNASRPFLQHKTAFPATGSCISAWIWLNSTTQQPQVIVDRNVLTTTEFALQLGLLNATVPGGNFDQICIALGGTSNLVDPSFRLPPVACLPASATPIRQWQHIAWSMSRSGGPATAYVNGQQAQLVRPTIGTPTGPAFTSATNGFWLGSARLGGFASNAYVRNLITSHQTLSPADFAYLASDGAFLDFAPSVAQASPSSSSSSALPSSSATISSSALPSSSAIASSSSTALPSSDVFSSSSSALLSSSDSSSQFESSASSSALSSTAAAAVFSSSDSSSQPSSSSADSTASSTASLFSSTADAELASSSAGESVSFFSSSPVVEEVSSSTAGESSSFSSSTFADAASSTAAGESSSLSSTAANNQADSSTATSSISGSIAVSSTAATSLLNALTSTGSSSAVGQRSSSASSSSSSLPKVVSSSVSSSTGSSSVVSSSSSTRTIRTPSSSSSTGIANFQISAASSSSQLSASAIAVIAVVSVVATTAAVGFAGYSVQSIRAARAGVGHRMRRVATEV